MNADSLASPISQTTYSHSTTDDRLLHSEKEERTFQLLFLFWCHWIIMSHTIPASSFICRMPTFFFSSPVDYLPPMVAHEVLPPCDDKQKVHWKAVTHINMVGFVLLQFCKGPWCCATSLPLVNAHASRQWLSVHGVFNTAITKDSRYFHLQTCHHLHLTGYQTQFFKKQACLCASCSHLFLCFSVPICCFINSNDLLMAPWDPN